MNKKTKEEENDKERFKRILLLLENINNNRESKFVTKGEMLIKKIKSQKAINDKKRKLVFENDLINNLKKIKKK